MYYLQYEWRCCIGYTRNDFNRENSKKISCKSEVVSLETARVVVSHLQQLIKL